MNSLRIPQEAIRSYKLNLRLVIIPSEPLAITWQEQVYDHVFFVLDQYAYLDRKLKMYENVFVNQRRTDKQWTQINAKT